MGNLRFSKRNRHLIIQIFIYVTLLVQAYGKKKGSHHTHKKQHINTLKVFVIFLGKKPTKQEKQISCGHCGPSVGYNVKGPQLQKLWWKIN